MSKPKVWALWAYQVGAKQQGGFIESSKGRPYRTLQAVARSMNSNGDGARYEVREFREGITRAFVVGFGDRLNL